MAGERVLVIEDNALNMELVRDLLEAAGYVVIEAGDAEGGMQLARAESPNLILIDIGLPGMDGLTATRKLKQDPATAGIPIICLTSHAMVGDEEKAMAAGADGYITKPIDTRTLVADVTRFISGKDSEE